MLLTDPATLNRLWEELRALGVQGNPRTTLQMLPFIGDSAPSKRAYLIESLFTGLFTNEADILIRCWVQAHGYSEALKAINEWPNAWLADCLSLLRRRAEGHFLRGEV